MKMIEMFITRRPFCACIISLLAGGILSNMSLNFLPWDLLWFSLLGMVIFLDNKLTKRSVAVPLALSFLLCSIPAKAEEPQPLPALVVGGLVVLVLGGGTLVGCKIVNKCKKIAAPKTNDWTEEFAPAGGSYGAAFSWGEYDYCEQERLLDTSPTIRATLDVVILSKTNYTLDFCQDKGESYGIGLLEFRNYLSDIEGLELISSRGQYASFAFNHKPAFPGLVPLYMDFDSRTVLFDGGSILVKLESSPDLIEWTPISKMKVKQGTRLILEDVSQQKTMFYRVAIGGDLK